MTKNLSIYLDLVRVCAALCVMFFHASFPRYGGAWLKPVFGGLGTDAVVVFFVLSGLVISYASRKEGSLRTYMTNRLARLWSVVIPALVLTYFADMAGRAMSPDVYPASYPVDHPFLRLAASALFVNQVWFAGIQPLSNGPFWSLSYEFAYYLMFGFAVFVGGMRGKILAAIVAMLAGPIILLMFPIWLAGVLVERHQHTLSFGRVKSVLMMLGAPVVLFVIHDFNLGDEYFWKIHSHIRHDLMYSGVFLTSNLFGLFVAIHFAGFISADKQFAFDLGRIAPPVRWIAGYTLSIYLYHVPLLHLFAALYRPSGDSDPLRNVAVIASALAVAIVLGHYTEKKKGSVRRLLGRLIGIAPPAPDRNEVVQAPVAAAPGVIPGTVRPGSSA